MKERATGTINGPSFADLLDEVRSRLAAGRPVRADLPGGGHVHIDRRVPFLLAYRRPPDRPDPGTERLVRNESSYLVSPSDPPDLAPRVVRAAATVLAADLGAFLVLELWAMERPEDMPLTARSPHFRITAPEPAPPLAVLETLEKSLRRVEVFQKSSRVEVLHPPAAAVRPHGLPPLLEPGEAAEIGCSLLGLEVYPVYRDRRTGDLFPIVLSALHRQVSTAVRRTAHRFALDCTRDAPESYLALGRRKLVEPVWQVDEHLARMSDAFEFLLHVTPINVDAAWEEFRRRDFTEPPEFLYRPLPADPSLLKRELFQIPLEGVEDPALEQLFREKQLELDRKLTMVIDRETARFLHGSLQLYGDIEDDLVALAESILDSLPPGDSEPGWRVSALAIADAARREIERYRERHPSFRASVEVRDDMYPGVMVSRDRLIIGRRTAVPRERVETLLHHEVGTHLLTYFNGSRQPLKVLRSGLAGHDELQEGLAVLAEHLCGGLDSSRLRLLAARVVAARLVVEGASFVDLFDLLHGEYGFGPRSAFGISMRLHRGGGLTKDAIYLRGLVETLEYIGTGGPIDRLLAGKISPRYADILHELEVRQVIHAPSLLPLYLDSPAARRRLEALRGGACVFDLVASAPR